MEPLAWGSLVCSFLASCATTIEPWSAGAFIGSFVWVAYLQEKKKGTRK